jgi:DNA primase
MRFPPEFLDELRARLPVSEVVRRRVQLKKAGREWKGLSPFNKERTPSFFVNDQKGMWFDFSSGKNGNIFSFVMETEGVSFAEAVERLAAMAGLALPAASPEREAREERRKSLYEVMELAARFYETSLAGRGGAHARGYLADRGIDPAMQRRFRLGYAPAGRFALKEHLGAHGVPVADMVEAGLLVAGDDIPLPYDRFRDRVMFPITDWRGQVIAFGGRALERDAPAKYLNSPETPLFHKGAVLYNGAAARQAAHKGARVIAVEGYIDVIAMVRVGFVATVAPLGTALTEEQLALLWRMTDEPILLFDGDTAGRRAADRAVDLALPQLRPGKSLLFATLPEGQDPDDLVRVGGRTAVEDVLSAARPLVAVLWARETGDGPFDTPERRAALEARIAAVTAQIGDPAVRKHYREELDARLRRLFARTETPRFHRRSRRGMPARRERVRNPIGPVGGEPVVLPEPYETLSPQLTASPLHRSHRVAIPRREALILQAILNHPWLLDCSLEEITALEFRHPDAEKLRSALIDLAAHGEASEDLAAALDRQGLGPLRQRIERSITTQDVWGVRADAAEDDVRVTFKQLITLHRQHHSLIKELKEAERALGEDGSQANFDWLRDVKQRLGVIDGTEALIDGFGASSGRPVRSL